MPCTRGWPLAVRREQLRVAALDADLARSARGCPMSRRQRCRPSGEMSGEILPAGLPGCQLVQAASIGVDEPVSAPVRVDRLGRRRAVWRGPDVLEDDPARRPV